MSEALTLLSPRRPELLIRPHGADGQVVVKDPRSGSFFHLGAEEHFLLMQLDGHKDAAAICGAFVERFGESLREEELDEFVETALRQGFLQSSAAVDRAPPKQNLLCWRKALIDPDRLFTWLEPKIRCFWTRGFLVVSAACILFAAFLVWANWREVTGNTSQWWRWQTAVWVWLTLMIVTTLHEFAHGLTCKHYGGDVHEIGFLLLFFMPCFYCNVSDAWLFKEKSKRLWVTFAGGYFELFLWALAVFLWRVTLPGSSLNDFAFIVVAACGVQTLFNFLPLLKLDGYYLVSDWQEIPNLHQRALARLKGHVRRLLWGAPKPDAEPHGRFLLGFGLATWLYSAGLLVATLWMVGHFLGERQHWFALGAVMLLGFFALRSLLQGFAAGEITNMFFFRHKRTVVWLTVLLGLPLVLALVKIEDRASGPFRLRPPLSVEVRTPVAGFVKEVYCEEGSRMASGEIVARLEAPDLESRLTQKQAEVSEVRARLRLLEIGARPEEVLEQRQRVERATAWRDLAQKDLTLTKQALAEDLDRLEQQIKAGSAELDVARDALERANTLAGARSIGASELRDAQGKSLVSQARLAEAQAAKRALQLKGTLEAQVELARREQALAEAQALLRLLEAGARPQEIDAERARLARLREEVRRLQEQQRQLAVVALAHGVVTTTRMKDKVGQYVREGDLICVLEEPGDLEAEIAVAEQDIARIQPGHEVALKARALAFDTFRTRVDRIAPAAGPGEGQSCVKVFCRLGDYPADLRPEMTGHARIYTGRRPIGAIVVDRALRWLRTEFWW